MGWRGSCMYGWVVLGTLLVLLAVGAVHLLDWWSPGDAYGLFSKLEPDVWDEFDVEVVNTDWLFYIWVVVYMLQVVWVLYGAHLLCRGTPIGNLYAEYRLIPLACFLLYTIALVGQFGWLLLWTTTYYQYSPLCLAITCVLAYVVLAMAVLSTRLLTPDLRKAKSIGVVWENRWIVHNAMAAYAAWTTVVFLYTITVIIEEHTGIAERSAGYIFLGILMALQGVWFTVDMFLARDALHGLITPYVITSITLTSVLVKNISRLNYYFTISAVFLGFSLLILVVKMCVMCWYKRLARDSFKDNRPPRQEMSLEQMQQEQARREGRIILAR